MAMILLRVVIGEVSGGWAQYRSIKWSMKIIKSRRSHLGSYWTFLVLTTFKNEDERHWPALRGLPSPLKTIYRQPWPANGTKTPFKAYTGPKISCHKNQILDYCSRHK